MSSIEYLFYESYVAHIKNSRGSHTYRNNFALVDGKKKDITKNGALSCAFFVSSILRTVGLLESVHTTVSGTLRDMQKSGWKKVKIPRPGAVIYWEAKVGASGTHEHLGFCLDSTHAISNSPRTRTPEVHHITYGHKKDGTPRRRIIAFYIHPRFSARLTT